MSSEVIQREHHHHHHHHHHHTLGRSSHKLSRSKTVERNSQEKEIEGAKCARHAGNGHHHDTGSSSQIKKSPTPARPSEPPKVASKDKDKVAPPRPESSPKMTSTPLSRRSHSKDCKKLSRSQSSSSSSRPSSSSNKSHSTVNYNTHNCHSGPSVVITQYKERGDELVTEAESKLSRSLFRSGDVQGGLDSYQRAVAQYKLAGDWDTAALTLTKMGEIFRKQGDLMGAGRLYGEAGTCYRKYSTHSAVTSYLKSAEMYIELGKFGIPAKHHEAIAMIYFKDIQPCDNNLVLHHLSLAAHYYYSDNRNAARNKCRLEMARIHGTMDQYDEALQIYEDLGYSSLESRLIKYSADEYFFRAGLCHLAIDCLNCQIALQKYIDYYPAFEMSGECKFLKKLCGEIEQENEEGFDNIVRKNNSIVKLDPWYAAIINKIRKEIPGELNSLR